MTAMPRSRAIGQDLAGEAPIVRVAQVERHLKSIPVVSLREHLQVNVRRLVTGEADEANLSLLSRFHRGVDRAVLREEQIRVVVVVALVKLPEIDDVRSEARQALLELSHRPTRIPCAALGHQERLLPIAVAQRLSHPSLALALVVLPGVVQEAHAVVERGADDGDPFRLLRDPDVESADAQNRDLVPGLAEGAIGDSVPPLDRLRRGEEVDLPGQGQDGAGPLEKASTRKGHEGTSSAGGGLYMMPAL